MAIKPEEAYKKAMNQADLKKLEDRIDQMLIEGLKDSRLITINADLLKNRVIGKEIMKRYIKAGWEVEYTSDQRDGEYYSFTAKLREDC